VRACVRAAAADGAERIRKRTAQLADGCAAVVRTVVWLALRHLGRAVRGRAAARLQHRPLDEFLAQAEVDDLCSRQRPWRPCQRPKNAPDRQACTRALGNGCAQSHSFLCAASLQLKRLGAVRCGGVAPVCAGCAVGPHTRHGRVYEAQRAVGILLRDISRHHYEWGRSSDVLNARTDANRAHGCNSPTP
jgi:hypothetical protein